MSLIDNQQIQLLTKSMDLNVARQSMVSSNIANVDTPGYRTKDIDFKGELQRAQQQGFSAAFPPTVRQVTGLTERPDGNNVSIDREALLLSQVQLQFKTAEQLLRDQFKQIDMAINDGSVR